MSQASCEILKMTNDTATYREVQAVAPGRLGLTTKPLRYPLLDKAATVTTCGRICFNNQKINLSQVFAGQTVGIKQTEDRIWLVSFMDYDLGYFDDETCRLEPLANPFGPKVLPMFSE